MKKNLLSFKVAVLVTLLSSHYPSAQDTSPYWSLAGNSNAASSSKLGTTNLIPLNLTTNNLTRLRITTDGKVGIGTTNPQQRFHVEGPSLLNLFVSTTALSATSGSGMIGYTKHLPTAAGQRLGYFLLGSRGGTENNYHAAGMVGYAAGAWTAGSSYPAYLAFETTPSGSATRVERVRIDQNGNVGIGTTSPAYKLQVVGNTSISNGLTVGSGGIYGYGGLTNTLGVYGSGSSWGIYGTSPAIGIYGASTNNNYGGYFTSGYVGVYANGPTYGVRGNSEGGWGVWGHSPTGVGVGGTSGSRYGIYGNSSTSAGVYGNSNSNYGVEAHSSTTYAATAFGVHGIYSEGSTGYGIYGRSNSNYGGYFYSVSSYGIRAATGRSDKNWAGVFDGNVYTFGAYQTSDKNLKKNIEDVPEALSIINKLKPRKYEFRNDGKLAAMNLPKGKHYGFLAQDIEEILPNLVNELEAVISNHTIAKDLPRPNAAPSPEGSPMADNATLTVAPETANRESPAENLTIKSINYIELIPLLVRGMQELSKENQDLRQELAEVKQLANKFLNGQGITNAFGSNVMMQNMPNPVKGTTKIVYSLPEGSNRAQLAITDALGRTIKIIQLTRSGVVNFDSTALSAGIYNYSLIVDNKTLQTRQMTVEK